MPASPTWVRPAARLLLSALAASVALIGTAMALYPGGTWLDRGAPGHDFFRNFFCDLTGALALNGQRNPGAPLATAGMVVLALALAPFWLLVTRIFRERPRLALAVRALGLASAAATVLVPLLPSQRYGHLHEATIFIACAPGLLSAILATIGLRAPGSTKRTSSLPFYLAALTLALAAIDGAFYTQLVLSRQELSSPLLPALQKLAAIALVAWMTTTGVSVTRESSRDSSSEASAT